jgi:mRNA interferase ChpB
MARSTGSRKRGNLIEQGDIFNVSLDPTIGREQKGFRPVLVISPTEFNRVRNMPIVAPISTGADFARTAGFAVPLAGSGTETQGVVRCDQLRAMDLHARKAIRREQVPEFILSEVLNKVVVIFEPEEM